MIENGIKHHDLKIWPEHYQPIVDGFKTFEVRKNDRNYEVEDLVTLKEWDRNDKAYTGREMTFTIEYLIKGPTAGLPEGLCVFSVPV